MKKTLLVLLSVLLVVTSVLTLTACKQDCDSLGHEWGEWSVKTAATCTAAGEKVRTCSRCNEEGTEEIAALGHDWGEAVVVPATCGVAGTSTKSCSRCDATDVTDIPATENHKWVDDTASSKNKAATCTEKGVKAQKCSDCTATREVATEKIAHDLSGELVEAVAPDCGHDGTLAHVQCPMCEQYFDEEGELLESIVDPATGEHAWVEDEESEENVEATCGQAGVQAFKCEVCEAEKTEVVDPTGEHSFVDDEDEARADEKVPATCAPGVQPTKCEVCGELSTRKTDPTGEHDFADVELTQEVAATCTTEGTKAHKACNNCGLFCDAEGQIIGEGTEEDLVIPTIPHDMIDDEDGEGKVEATCGEAGVQPTKCSYGCGETGTREIPATGEHTFNSYEAVAETFTHNVFCSVCGEQQGEAAVACEGEWSYSEAGHHRECTLCGNEEDADHTWKTTGTYVSGQEQHTVQCSVASCTGTKTEDCNNKATGTCSVCRHVYVPATQWIVVGSTNGTNWSETTTNTALIFNYDHETKVYSLEISFKSGDEWNVKKNSSGWAGQLKGSNLTGTTFAEGVNSVANLFSGAGNIVVKFDCTVVITLNATQSSMSVLVLSVKEEALTEFTYTFHVYAPSQTTMQIHYWGAIDGSDWNSTKMTKDTENTGWFYYTATFYSAKAGTMSIIFHNGDTKYGVFNDGAGTGPAVTLAENMYFVHNDKTQCYATREAALAAAGVTTSALEALVPVIVKFELAA